MCIRDSVLLVPRNARQPRQRRAVGRVHRLRPLVRRAPARRVVARRRPRPQRQPASDRPAVRRVAGRRVLRSRRPLHAGQAGRTTGRRQHGAVRLLVLGHVGAARLHDARLFRAQRLARHDRILHHCTYRPIGSHAKPLQLLL